MVGNWHKTPMEIHIDRISPITTLLDEVFYRSSIEDMRRAYFQHVASLDSWMLLSDYYFGDDKSNKVVTFTALPYLGALPELQGIIRTLAPRDIKHARSIDGRFIEFLRQLPCLSISFLFQQESYFAWSSSGEFQEHLADFCDILIARVEFWRKDAINLARLDAVSKNIRHCAATATGQETNPSALRSVCRFPARRLCRQPALPGNCSHEPLLDVRPRSDERSRRQSRPGLVSDYVDRYREEKHFV